MTTKQTTPDPIVDPAPVDPAELAPVQTFVSPADGEEAIECSHPGVEGTAWLSPWWIENTDWTPVQK